MKVCTGSTDPNQKAVLKPQAISIAEKHLTSIIFQQEFFVNRPSVGIDSKKSPIWGMQLNSLETKITEQKRQLTNG